MYRPTSTAIVTVNYKNADVTLRCLEAILQLEEEPHSIVVVDNASGNQDIAILFEGWSHLAKHFGRNIPVCCKEGEAFPEKGDILLVQTQNGGFSVGNNAALRGLYASRPACTAFWLLNNDAFPEARALQILCERAKTYELVGSTVVYAAEPKIVQCAAGGIVSHIGITRFISGGEGLERVLASELQCVESQLDYINGASLFIRREVFDRIGFLPEEYFLYYEDVDFCTAAKQAGFRLGWAQQSIVLHMEGASCDANRNKKQNNIPQPPIVEYYASRNRIYFIKKFYPKKIYPAMLRIVVSLCLRIFRGHWRNVKIIVHAMADAVRGKMQITHVL